MSSIKIGAATIDGLESHPVSVEVDAVSGLRSFTVVGLPDTAVREAKERISSAIKNTGLQPPSQKNLRVTVNLAPAGIKKQGTLFDLPVALGYLLASGQVKFSPRDSIFVGELSLSGHLRSVRGAVALSSLAANTRGRSIFLPRENGPEAELVSEANVFGVTSLRELLDYMQGVGSIKPVETSVRPVNPLRARGGIDFSEIRGQGFAKRGLEIAAAGGHNVLMKGPPGSGKSLLAKAMTGIIPKLSEGEQIEVSRIYSVSGLLSSHRPVVQQRPFRAPHHSASSAAVLGGGSNPQPGEATLAHRGVLFLDELPEFRRDVLEGLRSPLEEGTVLISRTAGRHEFPASFILIAAMNPCPCGYYEDDTRACECTPGQLKQYQNKLSGPILDRMDLSVEVPRVSSQELMSQEASREESSAQVLERVSSARENQRSRFSGVKNASTNADMKVRDMNKFCIIDNTTREFLKKVVDKYLLSARAYHSILKVSRTIADLEGAEIITTAHIGEAVQYRKADQ